jgi:hypothetical protein
MHHPHSLHFLVHLCTNSPRGSHMPPVPSSKIAKEGSTFVCPSFVGSPSIGGIFKVERPERGLATHLTLAKRKKGARHEVDSEGSWRETLGPRDTNRIRGCHSWMSCPNTTKSEVAKGYGSKCGRYMRGQNPFLSGEARTFPVPGSWFASKE